MDIGMDRSGPDAGVATIGTLFQHIVNDMKNSSPLWEDFIAKATKLHACLRAAIQALAAYLDAFQKIADAATNSRGATKEIGTALTRVCLRHKAVESRMKTFTSAFMDCLIVPLQERLEDWRKQVTVIDKDHAKEYKRCRAELKKRSSDTLRLQKKAKKGQADNLHVLVESSMQDVTLRRCELEEVERKSLRAIMVEERSRYCTFVNMLQPVVHEECEVMSELSHLQEAMQLIAIVTKDPAQLPQASEELILESKANIGLYPDSPGGSNSQGGCSNSLGSRKSSVCSISSINSSSSGSPGHHQFQRSLSQYSPAIRLKPGESSDSGFCSSPALTSQASTLASQSHAVSTWPPHTQDATSTADRPHTISSAYEKGHQRPALTVYTFQSPETISETQKSPANVACRPPLPVRCSSLERPLSTTSVKNANSNVPRQCPSPIPPHITKEHPQLQPTYVNMTELASMAASKNTNSNNNNSINNNTASGNGGNSSAGFPNQHHQQQQQQQQSAGTSLLSHSQVYQSQQQQQQPNSPVLSSASSLISPDSNATNPISSPDASACSTQTPQNTPQTGSPGTPNYSSGGAPMLGYRSSTPSSSMAAGGTTSAASCDAGAAVTTPTEILEKTSMFEQQINNNQTTAPVLLQQQQQQQLSVPTSPAARSSNDPNALYGRRTNEEIYKSAGQLLLDRDADCIDKQTIEELNNLIGELDLFQREHESAMLGQQRQRCTNGLLGSDPETIVANGVNNNHSAPLRTMLDAEDGLQQQQQQGGRLPSSISSSNSNLDEYLSNNQSGSVEETNGSMTNLAAKYSNYGAAVTTDATSDYGAGTAGQYNPYHQHQHHHALGMLAGVGSTTGSSQGLDGIATGFENPSFMMENYYSQNSRSEVVVLRCKDTSRNSLNNAPDDLLTGSGLMQLNGTAINGSGGGGEHGSTQRLSSFRSTTSRPASPASMTSFFGISAASRSPTPSLSLPASANSSPAHHQHHLPNGGESTNAPSNNVQQGSSMAAPYDDRINRNKPAITPRPASLSGPTRVTRRASINTVKPPPPVRRSSSVTPSPSVGTNSTTIITNLAQQSLAYTSSESLPPPPAYLLDSAAGSSPSISGNVAGTVKALNEIRHTPASPSVLRRAQQQNNPPSNQGSPTLSNRSPKTNLQQQQGGIYAQPKQLASMSSFRTSSPGPQKPNSSFLAQLNAKIAPNKPPPPVQQPPPVAYQQHPNQLQQQQQQQQQSANNYIYTTAPSGNELIYQRSTPYNNNQQQQQQQQYYHSQQQQQPPPHPPREDHHLRNNNGSAGGSGSGTGGGNAGPTHNVLAKTSAGFLENLNARLAEQRLSGKAFAVRNLINSKALPDPRVCHESLMDQIKRGATLKRNRTINDRSAPKIH
uniref:IMD domain-containing protein n=1 Tax=Anopheles atroparvus TaxID=41427 RepID=A0AAG5DBD1_ANOAO